ncbi:hypothetical protein CO112_03585 [Candidatus Dojkabacteria bacterium CG_4_9_14_3_um_filter_150_Dojkabacteria_WS6_41_13]|uniref:Pyridoxamine 5'-phosphate oxidase N-terminal domain-containing protein n=1 Tax=Candidatus Dojkabacteria bacterium CG_4_10_14_0_2_um_filter_Dojkabacteria_WS6_41_15 TaxID=2014249 RepID=A0A2M7W168_9BACT|nr:MAG: hypothetical protein COX64_04160 [Candidatus Dojkabacteria bacterium CG_4_10_14_0_2_um_filter_Dojkabacteria_WS6_41_15]PJB22583.1 MAG: hypothetical protein CO112_03585 [Candidatus Dojkabacteria bacterium CG_4_9_14_3_um_filter_150_Dojkabacteria_WS6_41_13]
MKTEIQNRIKAFLANHYVMVCGVSEGTQPLVFTAWYVTENSQTLYFKSRTASHHIKALLKNPMIALAIYEHTSTYAEKAGVQAIGKVERVKSPVEMTKVVQLYSKAFAGAGAKLADIPSLLGEYISSTMYKIRIEKVKMVDSSEGIEMNEYEEL